MTKKKLFLGTIFVFFLFAFLVKGASANEGIIELRSTENDNPNRCFALSVFTDKGRYEILVTCRDLIYPPASELFSYTVWATPTVGGNPDKLGSLGSGKASFDTKETFSNLFVTVEQNGSTRTPAGKVVMRGNVSAISILDQQGQQVAQNNDQTGTDEQTSDSEEVQAPADETQQLSTKERLGIALRRAGIVSLIALVALVGLVFVISRSRS